MSNVFAPEAVAAFAYNKGLRGEALTIAVAIAGAESGFDASKHNPNAHTGDDSYGLWQINLFGSLAAPRRAQFNLIRDTDLLDPVVNARAMYEISGGGTSWQAWTTYRRGLHRPFLTRAAAAAASVSGQAGGAAPTVIAGDGATTAPVESSGDVFTDYFVQPDSIIDYQPSRFAQQLRFMRIQGSVTPQLTGGSVDMSTDKVTEMSLLFAQPINNPAGDILLLTEITWRSLVMLATAREYGPAGDMPEQLTITAQPAGVSKMRQIDPVGLARGWTNSSPTEVMQQRAHDAGLRFVGKGSQRRATITRHGKADTGASNAESDWDLGDRLAKELGFWFFEADGVVVFAPPSWIAGQFPTFTVRWRPADVEKRYATLTCPTARVSINTDRALGATLWPRTLSFELPRNRGELVRPGMIADFKGLPGFAGAFIVTNVSWSIADTTSPVTVDCIEPIDPIATDPTGEQESEDTGPAQGSGVDTVARPSGGGGLAPTALDFVTLCLKQVGDRYILGAAHDAAALANPNPTAFDCSGLVGWACYQLGVTGFTGTAGLQMTKIINAGLEVSVDRAAHTRGAILYRGTLTNPNDEHIVVSLGDGVHTVEAMGTAYGVKQGSIGHRFTRGGLIPGLDYAAGAS